MPTDNRSPSRFTTAELLTAVALLCLLAAQALHFAWAKSSTYDESEHVVAGYYALTLGDFSVDYQHPPLGRMWCALPLLFVDGLRLPAQWPDIHEVPPLFWGPVFMWRVNGNGVWLTRLTRLPMIALTLLTATVLFLWARKLYGRKAGWLALFLCAFTPDFLSHGAIATTDMPAACFCLIAAHAIWMWLGKPSPRRTLWAGIATGLALATKISALFLGPAFLLLITVQIYRDAHAPSALWHRVGQVCAFAILALLIGLLVPASVVMCFAVGLWFGNLALIWRGRGRTEAMAQAIRSFPLCAAVLLVSSALEFGVAWANMTVPMIYARLGLMGRLVCVAAGACAARLAIRLARYLAARVQSRWAALGRWALRSALLWLVALFVLWGCYGFARRRHQPGDYSPVPRLKALPGPVAKISGAALWRLMRVRLPLRSYWSGFELVSRLHSDVGQATWMLDSLRGRPASVYFATATATKTPLALLLLICVALGLSFRPGHRPHWREISLYVPALVLVAIVCRSKMTVGMRHVLPALPFAILWASRAARGAGRRLAWCIAGLCLWQAASVLSAAPNYLAYFNWLAGGPKHAADWFRDSNTDWGQDLPLLAEYQRRHPELRDLGLAYFGTADPAAYGVKATPIELALPWPGPVAASVTFLREEEPAQAWLRARPLLARIGGSIRIYGPAP